ncbi:MAG: hypothetical protein Q8P62_04270 [Candidatus Peregrinibacteria bacterium]|nr:hypothetical protein [Candidatus Peregrinibacteria bacterium]
MKIFGYWGANKFLKPFVYVAILSLFLSFSFRALAEEVVPEVVVPVEEVAPVGVEGVDPVLVEGEVPAVIPEVTQEGVVPTEEVAPAEDEVVDSAPVEGEAVPVEGGEEVMPEVVEPVEEEVVPVEGGEAVTSEVVPEIIGPMPEVVEPVEEVAPVGGDVATPEVNPASVNDFPMEFLQEKIVDEMAKKIPFEEIFPVSIAPQNDFHEVIEIDKNASHSCEFGVFEVAILEGQAFDVSMYLSGTDSAKTSVLKIGELPLGVTAKFSSNDDSIFSGVLSDSEILIRFNADMGAQKGSFNFPVVYTQVDDGGGSSINICQLNLIVQ